MSLIAELFTMKGRIDRKTFWTGWAVHLVLSFGLAALWLLIESFSNLVVATLVVLPLRAPLFMQQISIYIRRLHDTGKRWNGALMLPLIYEIMGAIAIVFAFPALGAGAECRLTGYDDCGDASSFLSIVIYAGYGLMTGLPGPLSLLFALFVGLRKARGGGPS